MRCGELLGLKWKDINFNNKTLKIERQCIYAYGNTNPTLADPKAEKAEEKLILLITISQRLRYISPGYQARCFQ